MPSKSQYVLALVFGYVPGYKGGGPIRSVHNLVETLSDEFLFKIVTQDRDLGEKSPYPGVVKNQWVRVGGAYVMYLGTGFRAILRMCVLLCSVDSETVLYLNSFFSRKFSMLAVLMRRLKLCRARCLVLAPRGELFEAALEFKRKRKRFYINVSRLLGLYSNMIWHASSELEAATILREFPLARFVDVAGVLSEAACISTKNGIVATASDLSGTTRGLRRGAPPKDPGQLSVVFVARVTRNKNLLEALRILEGISGDISFDIYGPIQDTDYWEECRGAISRLPANIHVQYLGEIEHGRVEEVFSEHHLLLFPTLTENFGHVISEALSAGCPVLISNQTPWQHLEAAGVGWDIPLGDRERFRSVLQQCVNSDREWFTALSIRARDFALNAASNSEVITANRQIFRRAQNWGIEPMPTLEL